MLLVILMTAPAWANVSVDFRQGSNNDLATMGQVEWINSILQASNSRYYEGMVVPQRVVLIDIAPTSGHIHSLEFKVESTKGGIHAYDFITGWDDVDPTWWNIGDFHATLNECGPNIGPPANLGTICSGLRAGANWISVPVPMDTFEDAEDGFYQPRIEAFESVYGARAIKIYGNAPITGAEFVKPSVSPSDIIYHSGDGTGDTDTYYKVQWTSAATQIVIEFGGHLSMTGDPADMPLAWGTDQGSSQINGGPYHFSLGNLDTSVSLGNQDNQIKGADIILPPPTCEITEPQTICAGQTAALTVTGVGGTPPYTYAWTGPGGFTATTATINVGIAGTYSAIVTDANLLSSEACSTTVTVTPLTTVNLTLDDTAICEGEPVNGSVVITGPYSNITWYLGATALTDCAGDTTCAIPTDGLTPGTKTVSVTVDGTCNDPQDSENFTVTAGTTVDLTLDDTELCEGDPLGGTVVIDGPYSDITWSLGGTELTDCAGDTTCAIPTTGLTPGAHTVYVTVDGECNDPHDAAGFTVTAATTVELALDDTELCEGDPLGGEVTITGPYSDITWYLGATELTDCAGDTTCAIPTAGLTPGTKTVSVTVDGTCNDPEDSATFIVTEPTTVELSLDDTELCEGDPLGGTVVIDGPYSDITWYLGATELTDCAGDTTCAIPTDGLTPGTHTVSVMVDGTCNDPEASAEFRVIDPTTAELALDDDELCEGDPLGGEVTITGPYSDVTWYLDGGELTDCAGDTTCAIPTAGLTPGTHTVSVMVDGTCNDPEDSVDFEVTEPTTVELALDDDELCEGDPLGGEVTITGPYSDITWYLGATELTDCAGDTTCAIPTDGLTPGTHSVSVMVDGTCNDPEDSVDFIVTEPTTVELALDDTELCEGEPLNGEVTITGPYSDITWYLGATELTDCAGDTTCAIPTDGLTPGTHTVSVMVDGTCNDPEDSAEFRVIDPTTAELALDDDELCEGDPLGGEVTITGPYSDVTWYLDGTELPDCAGDTTCAVPTAGLTPGTHSVSVMVDGTCNDPEDAVDFTVTEPTTVELSLDDDELCEPEPLNGTAAIDGPYSDVTWWLDGTELTDCAGNITCEIPTAGLTPGTHTVSIMVDGTCNDPEDSADFEVTPPTEVELTVDVEQVCDGEPVTVTAEITGEPELGTTWYLDGSELTDCADLAECVIDTTGFAAGTYLVSIEVDGVCNDPAAEIEFVVEPCDDFCSLTQGAYGNANGLFWFNGVPMRRLELIQAIIGDVPLTIGVPGRSLTVASANAQCIINRLPAGGPASALPAIGDASLTLPGCNTTPSLLGKKGTRFNNVLLGQVITLSLNTRLDPDLLSAPLCHYMVTQAALAGPDGALGTDDDVVDEYAYPQTHMIPQAIIDYLGEDADVADLLALANHLIAGHEVEGVSLSDINYAASAINEAFDECAFLQACTETIVLSTLTTLDAATAALPLCSNVSVAEIDTSSADAATAAVRPIRLSVPDEVLSALDMLTLPRTVAGLVKLESRIIKDRWVIGPVTPEMIEKTVNEVQHAVDRAGYRWTCEVQ